MEAFNTLVSFWKNTWPFISTVGVFVFGLLYFKYVKAPQDAIKRELNTAVDTLNGDINTLKTEFNTLKTKLDDLSSSLDSNNMSRVQEAVRDEETRLKVDSLQITVRQLEEKIADIRVDIARLSTKR